MVTLAWPPRELHPNARVHFHQRAKAAKACREAAYWATKASDERVAKDGPVRLKITFCPPDKRRRDIDGMLSASKAILDGVADALEVNDYRFELLLVRADPVPSGKVTIAVL